MDINIRYIADGTEKWSTDLENRDYEMIVDRDEEMMKVVIRAKKPLELVTSSIKIPYAYEKGCQVFLNGYQSWTDTREFELSEYIHNMNRVPRSIKEKYHFDAYGDAWFLKYHKDNFHSFTYSYIKHPDGKAEFIGSLNDHNSYLMIHHKKKEGELSVRSDCQYKKLAEDEEFCLYDYVRYTGSVEEVQKKYFEHFGRCKAPKIRGYTSWYLHYQDINENKISEALSAIDSDSFDLFQIDDGYETFVGDWMDIDQTKFPSGLKDIVDTIHSKGLKAGIWLAPFVCELKSKVYSEHPEWIYRENGKEVFAGNNWSGDVVLDIRQTVVQDYIKKCLYYYRDLGFDFFKLDFLYAAALIHANSGFTRAEIMRKAMKGLRDVLGNKLILGCGVPLSSAFGLVDYCRIGPDVSLKFDDVFYMRAMHRERISTKITIQNTIFRNAMDGYVFRCDPDVFLLRDNNIELSKEQRKALVMIDHLCGSVYMTSDNVGQYDDEKKAILKEAQRLSDASVKSIKKVGDLITIKYLLDGSEHELRYNREKGILI